MISRVFKKYVAIYFYISSRFVCGNIILLVEYLGGTPELQKLPGLGRQISAFRFTFPSFQIRYVSVDSEVSKT